MKYFKNKNNEVFAYEDDGSQEDFILSDLISITETEALAITNPPLTAGEILIKQVSDINNAIQNHLDTKAKSLRYDDINAIGKYVGYENAFRTEAEKLGAWASSCWKVAGVIEADVQAGNRAMPTVDEVLAELPVYGA